MEYKEKVLNGVTYLREGEDEYTEEYYYKYARSKKEEGEVEEDGEEEILIYKDGKPTDELDDVLDYYNDICAELRYYYSQNGGEDVLYEIVFCFLEIIRIIDIITDSAQIYFAKSKLTNFEDLNVITSEGCISGEKLHVYDYDEQEDEEVYDFEVTAFCSEIFPPEKIKNIYDKKDNLKGKSPFYVENRIVIFFSPYYLYSKFDDYTERRKLLRSFESLGSSIITFKINISEGLKNATVGSKVFKHMKRLHKNYILITPNIPLAVILGFESLFKSKEGKLILDIPKNSNSKHLVIMYKNAVQKITYGYNENFNYSDVIGLYLDIYEGYITFDRIQIENLFNAIKNYTISPETKKKVSERSILEKTFYPNSGKKFLENVYVIMNDNILFKEHIKIGHKIESKTELLGTIICFDKKDFGNLIFMNVRCNAILRCDIKKLCVFDGEDCIIYEIFISNNKDYDFKVDDVFIKARRVDGVNKTSKKRVSKTSNNVVSIDLNESYVSEDVYNIDEEEVTIKIENEISIKDEKDINIKQEPVDITDYLLNQQDEDTITDEGDYYIDLNQF